MKIFVDTGGWFSMVVTSDVDHSSVTGCFALFASDTLVTTDYVVDETLTLLRARGYDQRAQMLGEAFFGDTLAIVHYLDEIQIRAAWDVFRLYQDKRWSFTDCSSMVVMETLGITKAISLDRHFRQFGTIEVFPTP